jgi:hypothetical protein
MNDVIFSVTILSSCAAAIILLRQPVALSTVKPTILGHENCTTAAHANELRAHSVPPVRNSPDAYGCGGALMGRLMRQAGSVPGPRAAKHESTADSSPWQFE